MDATTTAQRHYVAYNAHPQDTCDWIHQFGYYAVVVGGIGLGVGDMGVAYGRPNQPAHIAVTGNVLVWDGHTLTVEEY